MQEIRYGYYWPDACSLGPGARFVLWVKGCDKNCPRCTSPDLRTASGARAATPSALAQAIIDAAPSGITISGGEPMLQADALAEMCRIVRETLPEINVIVFTGRTLEELVSPGQKALLAHTDLLIDGEYIDGLNDGIGLRGSSNQRLHFLTPALRSYEDELRTGPRSREIHLLSDYEVLTIGIPT